MTAKVDRPKFTSPLKACTVFFTAQRPWPRRSLGYPHELFAATEVVSDPEVSKASMKYGRDAAGHWVGSGERQDAGSAFAVVSPTRDAVRAATTRAAGFVSQAARRRAWNISSSGGLGQGYP